MVIALIPIHIISTHKILFFLSYAYFSFSHKPPFIQFFSTVSNSYISKICFKYYNSKI